MLSFYSIAGIVIGAWDTQNNLRPYEFAVCQSRESERFGDVSQGHPASKLRF